MTLTWAGQFIIGCLIAYFAIGFVQSLISLWIRGSREKAEARYAKERYFAKQREFQPVLTITITEAGVLEYIASDADDVLLELGEVVTRRASHVEPATFLPRVWFHIVRRFVSDKSAIAAWTREWKTTWRINCAPVGGPILPERFTNRQAAIDREIEFLNQWFLER